MRGPSTVWVVWYSTGLNNDEQDATVPKVHEGRAVDIGAFVQSVSDAFSFDVAGGSATAAAAADDAARYKHMLLSSGCGWVSVSAHQTLSDA